MAIIKMAHGGSAMTDAQGNYHGPEGAGYGPARANEDAAYFRSGAEAAQQRRADPVFGIGQMDRYDTQDAASRQAQVGALNLQQQAAAGNAPSQAAILASQGSQDALAAQRAAAAGAGPGASAIAQMNAASQAGAAQSSVANAAMQQRAAEDAAARAAYNQSAMGLRSADMGRTQLQGQRQMAEAQQAFDQRKANDAYALGQYGNQTALNLQQQQAATSRYAAENAHRSAQERTDLERDKAGTEIFKAVAGGMGNFIGGMGGAAGGAAAMSDERTKDATPEKSGQVAELLRSFEGAEYTYRDKYKDMPEAGRGGQYGPGSAQRIAATELGKHVAKPGKDGLFRVDMTSAVKAMMAGMAYQQREIDRLNRGAK